MDHISFETKGGIRIERETWTGPYRRDHDQLSGALDTRRGVLLSSSFEFPGRYTRLDMGFVDPPLVLTARGRAISVEALNERDPMFLYPELEARGASIHTEKVNDGVRLLIRRGG